MSQNKNTNFPPKQVQVTAPAAGNPHEAAIKSETPEVEQYSYGNATGNLVFQSEEAAKKIVEPTVFDEELKDARVAAQATPQVAHKNTDMSRMVKIRPKQTLKRFKVGRDWYHVKANVDTLVPKHVAVILEQKGLI